MTHRVLAILVLGVVACAGVPVLREVDPGTQTRTRRACMGLFPHADRWTAVHTMAITMPGGGHSLLMGVTKRAGDKVSTVLMTPEGVVLFRSEYFQGRIVVDRALPPVDGQAFRKGMFRDIRFLFFAPDTEPQKVGRTHDGRMVCRWVEDDTTVDVSLGQTKYIREYQGDTLTREALLSGRVRGGFSERVVFSVHGSLEYRMEFRLISVDDNPIL